MNENKNKSYPKGTAGNLLTSDVPIFKKSEKIIDVKSHVLTNSKNYTSINYVYIVESNNKLAGVASIKNILNTSDQDLEKPVFDLVGNQTLISVHPYSNQERAAQLAVKYNIKAMPVVDKEGIFLGTIDGDHILSIMHEEKVEDLLKFAGVFEETNHLDDFLSLPLLVSLKHRVPWLIIGLMGGLLISQLISFFETTLRDAVVIAAFIPMMVYMSNAVGQQVTALLIRDSALNSKLPYLKYFVKQFMSVIIIALLMSTLLFLSVLIIHNGFRIASAISLAMFCTVTSSILTGFVVPFIFIKLKQDPANTSGPIGTVIQDFLSVLIYFSVITLVL